MAKRVLDLSHTLQPLEDELHEILAELINLKATDSPLFGTAVEDFINKYGGSRYNSLDDLLQSSAIQANYTASTTVMPLDDLLKDLMPH